MRHNKVLITGSSGFLGANLTRQLGAEGWNVTGMDCREPDFTPPARVILGDIRDEALLEEALREVQPDIVFHLAAVSTIQRGAAQPQRTWDVNYEGTRRVLRAVKRNTDAVFVFASTDKVYGSLRNAEAYKEDFPLCPLESPYDASKAAADAFVQSVPGTLVLRFCNLYGPFDTNFERVVPASIRATLSGFPAVLHRYRDETGRSCDFFRDMLYVRDLTDTLCVLSSRLLSCPELTEEKVFNFGAAAPSSIQTVIQEIMLATGFTRPPDVRYVSRSRELDRQSVDFSKANRHLGFSPRTSLSEGISKTVQWFQTWKEEKR